MIQMFSKKTLLRTYAGVRTRENFYVFKCIICISVSIIREVTLRETNSFITSFQPMKAMSKSELAQRAGVSVNTLRSWMVPYAEELKKMGLRPNQKVMPPIIVKFLAEKLCIDL